MPFKVPRCQPFRLRGWGIYVSLSIGAAFALSLSLLLMWLERPLGMRNTQKALGLTGGFQDLGGEAEVWPAHLGRDLTGSA